MERENRLEEGRLVNVNANAIYDIAVPLMPSTTAPPPARQLTIQTLDGHGPFIRHRQDTIAADLINGARVVTSRKKPKQLKESTFLWSDVASYVTTTEQPPKLPEMESMSSGNSATDGEEAIELVQELSNMPPIPETIDGEPIDYLDGSDAIDQPVESLPPGYLTKDTPMDFVGTEIDNPTTPHRSRMYGVVGSSHDKDRQVRKALEEKERLRHLQKQRLKEAREREERRIEEERKMLEERKKLEEERLKLEREEQKKREEEERIAREKWERQLQEKILEERQKREKAEKERRRLEEERRKAEEMRKEGNRGVEEEEDRGGDEDARGDREEAARRRKAATRGAREEREKKRQEEEQERRKKEEEVRLEEERLAREEASLQRQEDEDKQQRIQDEEKRKEKEKEKRDKEKNDDDYDDEDNEGEESDEESDEQPSIKVLPPITQSSTNAGSFVQIPVHEYASILEKAQGTEQQDQLRLQQLMALQQTRLQSGVSQFSPFLDSASNSNNPLYSVYSLPFKKKMV
ncbi:unnamed protein product, partial [Mesorhabditis belari]|uniref:Uncharacterized protein n=1 Tax=Mesorhabditis belari TaxID=2138241 RepID=A0AAF3FH11_9BILA